MEEHTKNAANAAHEDRERIAEGTAITDEPLFTEERRADDPRAVVRWLVSLRERRGLSQAHVADWTGLAQSSVSRFESGEDEHLGLAETARYVEALGMRCVLRIDDDLMPHDVQLRRTVLDATRLLLRMHALLRLRGGSRTLLAELDAFIGESLGPMMIEALDSGVLERDAVRGIVSAELAPGA